MKTTDDDFISDEHFDVLLRHALLEQEKISNEQTMETMAQTILAADYADSTDSASASDNHTIIEKLTRDFKIGGSKFRLNIFLLSFITIATIASVLFFTSKNQKVVAQANSVQVVVKNNAATNQSLPVIPTEVNENPLPQTNAVMAAIMDSTKKEDSIQTNNINNGPSKSIPTTFHIPEDNTLHYEDVPTLTGVQKIQTAKDKLKILKDIVNPRKKVYTLMPAGETSVNDTMVKVQSFYIKNSEVTNFEYRTFLNDLLVQGNYDDYLLAAPVKDGWKAVGIPEFDNVYFESEKYNDFPAVNMSRKGAELFCHWLSTEMNSAIDKKEIKGQYIAYFDFYLPNNIWWIYAARAGDTTAIQYPWEKYVKQPGVQNNIGCYLCDLNYSISKNKLAPEGPAMNKNNNKGCIAAKMSTRAIVTTAARAIDTLVTAPVYSYNPNNSGLYCTLGNVAEMVWTQDPKVSHPKEGVLRAMGGSWYSDVDNVKIEAPEQYVGVTDGRAYIGFRPVFTFIMKK